MILSKFQKISSTLKSTWKQMKIMRLFLGWPLAMTNWTKKKKVNEILIGEYSKSNINFIKHDNLYARRHWNMSSLHLNSNGTNIGKILFYLKIFGSNWLLSKINQNFEKSALLDLISTQNNSNKDLTKKTR